MKLFLILSFITTSLARKKHPPQPQVWELSSEFTCPDYSYYAYQKHPPFSAGKYQLPYQRPVPACRKFNLTEVEDAISDMKQIIKDPDLFRLFENCFPNTLDTAIAWKGIAAKGHEDEYYGEDGYEEEVGSHSPLMVSEYRVRLTSTQTAHLHNNRRHPRPLAPRLRQPTPFLPFPFASLFFSIISRLSVQGTDQPPSALHFVFSAL